MLTNALFLWLVGLGLVVPALAYSNVSIGDSNYTVGLNDTSGFSFANNDTSDTFQYRGVALGGWLVLEPYITPSLFLAFNALGSANSTIPNDEYHYCKMLGQLEAQERLEKHWLTFYNETDFEDIKNAGFNMVRIPIGYWAFSQLEDDPYVYGAQTYLDHAIEWAYLNGLKVWVDLHGAPGLQNGFDNLGLFRYNDPKWQTAENIALTIKVLGQIYLKYGLANFTEAYGDTILGIEVLNEPLGSKLNMTELKQFYEAAYLESSLLDTNLTVVFHDAFQGSGYWDDFFDSNTTIYDNILVDHHHYEVFTAGQLNDTIAQHLSNIKSFAGGIAEETHPAVVGEWSGALTDCTPWLNSVHFGNRWEGTYPYTNYPINNTACGSCADINDWDSWTNKHKVDTRKLIEMQLDEYEANSMGWIFWCYKTETTIEWDFKRLTEFGLFPLPFSDREYIENGTDTKPNSAGAKIDIPWSTYVLVLVLSLGTMQVW